MADREQHSRRDDNQPLLGDSYDWLTSDDPPFDPGHGNGYDLPQSALAAATNFPNQINWWVDPGYLNRNFGSGHATSHANSFATSATPTITTDKPDYAPGSTATISVSGFQPNTTIEFQVLTITSPGADS